VIEPFSNSDHCMVNFQLILSCHEQLHNPESYVYDFQNCDFDGIAPALLQHPLNFSTPHGTADDAWMHFIQPVYDVIDKFVPVKAKRPINKKVSSKKYPKHIIRAVRKKATLWRRYSHSKTSFNKAAYCEQVEVYKSLVFEYERTN